jgi:hypothetical protein
MGDRVSQMFVEIDAGSGDDAEYLARLTYRLRDELLALDVDNVELAAVGEAPDGSMGVSALATGGLVVRFVTQDALRLIVSSVRSWLARQHCRSVKLTLGGDSLEVTGISSAAQDKLIDLWMARHVSEG